MPHEIPYQNQYSEFNTIENAITNAFEGSIPLVSVIIRSMGRPSLREALLSVVHQSYSMIEVIVVNAKGQGHQELPTQIGTVPLRLVSRQTPLLRSAAGNAGLDSARGKYLIFLDDDDLFEPTHIERLIQTLSEHPEALLAYADVRIVSAEGVTLGCFNQDYLAARLWSGNFLPIHAVLFDRKLVELGCRFDEALDSYEDWDFWLQASRWSTFVHCPSLGATYRIALSQSGMATNAPEFLPLQLEAKKVIWRKWWPRYDVETFIDTIEDLKHQLDLSNKNAAEHAAELGQLRASYESLTTQFSQLENTAARQTHDIARLEGMLEDSERRSAQNEQIIDALRSSTSWRITAPLRLAGRPVAQFRHLLAAWRAQQMSTEGATPSVLTLLLKTVRTLLREGTSGIKLRTTALQSRTIAPGPLVANVKSPPAASRNLLSWADIERYETFFIDVFDTAVIRTWCAPTDVFKYLAANKKDSDFARRRVEREANTRTEFKSQREVSLEQIYAKLPKDELSEEIDAELRFCVANPEFKPLYDRLVESSKTIYFVSDMYLDKDSVTRILSRCGFQHYKNLFVSSEDQLLKGDGSRFAWLKVTLPGCEQQAIHIGDNPIADHAQPRAHGFATHRLPTAEEWFDMDDFITSKWPALRDKRSLGQSAILGLFRAWKSGFIGRETPSYWRQFGFFYGGALVSAFCGYIHAELDKRRLDVSRLFFLARDGDILSRAYRVLYEKPDPVYTFASRRCMSFAALYSLDEADDKNQLRLFTTSVGVSGATDILERLGYPDLTGLELDLLRQQSSGQPWTDANILAALQKHRDTLLVKAATERDILLDYLREIGFFDEADAVVIDVGWSGSIQNALHKIIAREFASTPRLHGIYLGVYGDALYKEHKSGYLFDGVPAPFAPYLNLIELLTSSPQDGVMRLQRGVCSFEPIPAKRTEHEAQRQEISEQIQRGILEFADLARQHFDADLGFLKPEDFEHLFSTLRTHTSELDSTELGRLRHAMTLGNKFDQFVLTGA